jgi:hypothetical protein
MPSFDIQELYQIRKAHGPNYSYHVISQNIFQQRIKIRPVKVQTLLIPNKLRGQRKKIRCIWSTNFSDALKTSLPTVGNLTLQNPTNSELRKFAFDVQKRTKNAVVKLFSLPTYLQPLKNQLKG